MRRSVTIAAAAGAVGAAVVIGVAVWPSSTPELPGPGNAPGPTAGAEQPGPPPSGAPMDEATHVAAIYRGDAGCPGCSETAAQMLAQDTERTWAIRYVGEDEDLAVTSENLEDVDMYVQPGGSGTIYRAWPALGTTAQDAVQEYVEDGGYYLGLCMGGFFAGEFDDIGWGWIPDVSTYFGADENQTVTTTWGGVGERDVWWVNGTTFGESKDDTEVLGRYDDDEAAAVVTTAGDGFVGGIGPHVEATESWYDAEAWNDEDGYDADLGLLVVDELMSR